MIHAKNLYFRYDKGFVLKNVSLEIEDGSFTAIIGANGSGKTTLARHFNALLLPTRGNVAIDGIDTRQDELSARKKVGFVFQNFEDQIVYPTVLEDVSFGLENLGIKNSGIKKTANETLDMLKIKSLANSNVNSLSSGQRQLVALAGVLAMEPKYIVFDEPTTMLDAKNKKNILGIIRQLNKNDKITVVLITNALEDLKYAGRVVLLKNGSIAFDGKKSGLNKKILKESGLCD